MSWSLFHNSKIQIQKSKIVPEQGFRSGINYLLFFNRQSSILKLQSYYAGRVELFNYLKAHPCVKSEDATPLSFQQSIVDLAPIFSRPADYCKI